VFGLSPLLVRLRFPGGSSPSLNHVPFPVRRQISHFWTGPPPLPGDHRTLIVVCPTPLSWRKGALGASGGCSFGASEGSGMNDGIGVPEGSAERLG
jgi:hypothetical protein